jgi:hypothetical protein
MNQFTISHLAINNPAKTDQKQGVKVVLSNQEINKVGEQVDKGLNKIGENAAEGEGATKGDSEGLKADVERTGASAKVSDLNADVNDRIPANRRNEVTIVDERDRRPFDRANILKRLASKGIYTTSKNVNAKPDGGLEESKMDEKVAEAKESEDYDNQITLADSIIPPSIEFTNPTTK